jgi:hypothetical protein
MDKEMEAVTIPVVVGPDRRLVLDLPPSTPIGPANVVILPRTNGADERATSVRDTARAKLLAAGFLATDIRAPDGTARLSDEDLAHLGQLPAGARPSEDLIDEDRGSY